MGIRLPLLSRKGLHTEQTDEELCPHIHNEGEKASAGSLNHRYPMLTYRSKR